MFQKSQMEALKVERDNEEAHLYVIRLNLHEVTQTSKGKEDSRSINIQIINFIKTLTEDEKDNNLTFIGLDETFDKFKDYLQEKYKGSQKTEWIEKLSIPSYESDVKRVFMSKIYDHKAQRTIEGQNFFFSPTAHNHYQHNNILKEQRATMHEALGRFNKNLEGKNTASIPKEELQMLMDNSVEKVMNKRFPNMLPNRKNEDNLLN